MVDDILNELLTQVEYEDQREKFDEVFGHLFETWK